MPLPIRLALDALNAKKTFSLPPSIPPEVWDFGRRMLFFIDDGIKKNSSVRQVTDQIYDAARERPLILEYRPHLKDYERVKKMVEGSFQHFKDKKFLGEINQGQGVGDFHNFGRKLFAGPKYGQWCGQDWSGGTNPEFADPKEALRAPVDSLDDACETHDRCYDQATDSKDKLKCDARLIDAWEILDPNPENWAQPPTSNDMAERAKLYRTFGEYFFRGKLYLSE